MTRSASGRDGIISFEKVKGRFVVQLPKLRTWP